MDWYRKLLAKAHRDWLEYKFCAYHRRRRGAIKDRRSGRAEKRSAGAMEKADRDR